jgi:hypothetical protein
LRFRNPLLASQSFLVQFSPALFFSLSKHKMLHKPDVRAAGIPAYAISGVFIDINDVMHTGATSAFW